MQVDEIFRRNLEAMRQSVLSTTEDYIQPAIRCIEATKRCLEGGHKLLLAGNGGSATTASHITNDFIGHMVNWNRRGYPAIALTADISVLTALTNDYGYDRVFSRQIEALGSEGDIFWCLSTSGNSKNIVLAVEECKKRGVTSVAFTARKGGQLRELADIWVPVNTDELMLSEALHLFYFHSIAESVEALLDPVREK